MIPLIGKVKSISKSKCVTNEVNFLCYTNYMSYFASSLQYVETCTAKRNLLSALGDPKAVWEVIPAF